MKRTLQYVFHNWRAKLACLAAAVVIWLVLNHNIALPNR